MTGGRVKPAQPGMRRWGGRHVIRESASSPRGALPRQAVTGPRGAPWMGVVLHLRHNPVHVLLISPYTMHRHPAFWEAPEYYEPERFQRERALGCPRYAYFPFGGGPHLCLGRGLARPALQVMVALMVRTHRLR